MFAKKLKKKAFQPAKKQRSTKLSKPQPVEEEVDEEMDQVEAQDNEDVEKYIMMI
jgi:biopolymer transport protein ExbB/TolQ